MKKIGSTIIIALNIIGIICLVYYAVPYIRHDTFVPNPDAMIPFPRWERAAIILTLGTIPLLVANLLAFLTVWKEKIRIPVRFLFFLPGLICFIMAITYWLPSDMKTERTLVWLYDNGGINVTWGDRLCSKDNHGFHGDGSSLHVYNYTDSSMQPEMEESELWNRHSINCTVAIYDADEDILYVFEEDT